MTTTPQRIVAQGPYRYTRNPMYLGHLIFMLGLALMFWSWFGLVLFVARAAWFQHRVLGYEAQTPALTAWADCACSR
jgi:protein-S-isoprenylcysteine O-methyltransferase Ste14